MKKRISDMMDCIHDVDYELNQETPLSSQRIKELTMNKITNKRKPRRTLYRILVAAAVITALTATVFAAGNLGWFRQYFEKQNDEPLSPGQIEFIEENEQLVTEPQVQNNCTIELKSLMTDGQYMCMILGVTAPEGMKIENAEIGNWGNRDREILMPEAVWTLVGSGKFMVMEDDGDGMDNTTNIVFEAMFEYEETDKPFDKGTVWNLHIEDLTASCVNEEYLSQFEMVDGAYVLSGEEAALAYPTLTLAEGTWDYQFGIEAGDFREIEIILDEPIIASTVVGVKPMPDGSYPEYSEDVTITSVTLRSMGMTVACSEYPTFTYKEPCKLVMRDGNSVEVVSYWSQYYSSRAPIVLDEVDHILLADGTKIMVP